MHDKELRGCRILIISPCHRKNALNVSEVVFKSVRVKLTLDGACGMMSQAGVKCAALDHKVFDNSVENKSVIELVANKVFEVSYSFRCNLGEQSDKNVTVSCNLYNNVVCVSVCLLKIFDVSIAEIDLVRRRRIVLRRGWRIFFRFRCSSRTRRGGRCRGIVVQINIARAKQKRDHHKQRTDRQKTFFHLKISFIIINNEKFALPLFQYSIYFPKNQQKF